MKLHTIKYNKSLVVFIILNIIGVYSIFSANRYSIKAGNWTDPSVWSTTSGGAACNCTPSSADNVYVQTNITLNTDLTGGNKITGLLQINTGSTLDGTGFNLDVGNGGTLVINGTLKINNLTFLNSSIETVGSSGAVYVLGNFSNNNNNTGVTFNGTINVTGDFYNGNGASIVGSGIINYTGGLTNNGTINGSNTGSGQINLGSGLPIELASIKIKCTSTGSLLTWTTASELNNNFFTIEKSTDMKIWKISTVIQGAFNSNELRNYEYLDMESNDVTAYYRLKQTDLDGKFKYFDALAILCKLGNDNFEVVGINVSDQHLNVIMKTQGFSPVTIEFFDMYGKKITEKIHEPIAGANIVNLDVPVLSAGIYIVTMIQDGNKISKKIYMN